MGPILESTQSENCHLILRIKFWTLYQQTKQAVSFLECKNMQKPLSWQIILKIMFNKPVLLFHWFSTNNKFTLKIRFYELWYLRETIAISEIS